MFHKILQPSTPATPKAQNAISKTLFVGNLSYKVEQTDVYVILPVSLLDWHFLHQFSDFTIQNCSGKTSLKIVKWLKSVLPQMKMADLKALGMLILPQRKQHKK